MSSVIWNPRRKTPQKLRTHKSPSNLSIFSYKRWQMCKGKTTNRNIYYILNKCSSKKRKKIVQLIQSTPHETHYENEFGWFFWLKKRDEWTPVAATVVLLPFAKKVNGKKNGPSSHKNLLCKEWMEMIPWHLFEWTIRLLSFFSHSVIWEALPLLFSRSKKRGEWFLRHFLASTLNCVTRAFPDSQSCLSDACDASSWGTFCWKRNMMSQRTSFHLLCEAKSMNELPPHPETKFLHQKHL